MVTRLKGLDSSRGVARESLCVCVCVCVHYHEEQGVTPCFCELQRWLKGGWVEQRCELS